MGSEKTFAVVFEPLKKRLEEMIEEVKNKDQTGEKLVWFPTWKKTGEGFAGAPRNGHSGRYYTGTNMVILTLAGFQYGDCRWYSWSDIQRRKATLHKGAPKLQVVMSFPYYCRVGERGCLSQKECWKLKVHRMSDKELKEQGLRKGWACKWHNVYNHVHVNWVEGSEASEIPATSLTETDEIVRGLTDDKGMVLRHGGDAAYYSPGGDFVQMPNREQFSGEDEYYSTLFHEAAHWTGHTSRLDRGLGHESDKAAFGSNEYAREELVAELSAVMLCAHTGRTPECRHADYLCHWLKAVEDKPSSLYYASQAAKHAVQFIIE